MDNSNDQQAPLGSVSPTYTYSEPHSEQPPLDLARMYQRQEDILKPDELVFPVTVVGAGGIGSWTALSLAKMGCRNLTVVDADRVEEHNVASQVYGRHHIGELKAHALGQAVRMLAGADIQQVSMTFEKYFESEAFAIPDVLIIAVDSISARKEIWELMKPLLDMTQLYIDARMGGETLRLMAVSPLAPETIEAYERKLFGTTKPHKEACTGRAIVYNTQMAGALIANMVKKYAKKEEVQRDFFFDVTDVQSF